MSEPRATVLLASVGSAIGGTILDALDLDPTLRRRLRLIGVHGQAEAANNFRCDRCYLAPSPEDEHAYLARLGAIVAAERPKLVLACRDDVLVPLARLAETLDRDATTVLVSSAAASAIAGDKYATHVFARRHGLPFAETAIDCAGLDQIERVYGYPMIAKPRGGAGSIGVSIVRHRAEAEAALSVADSCLQPFIGPPADLDALLPDFRRGPPLAYSLPGVDASTVNVVVDRDGSVIAFGAWKHPLVIMGEYRRGEPDTDPALAMAGRAFIAAFTTEGLFGPCSFQFRQDGDGRPVCFEINARIGGFWGSRARLGFPVVSHTIAHFVFGPLPLLPMPPDTGRFILRALADRVIDRADVARLARDGVWEAPAP